MFEQDRPDIAKDLLQLATGLMAVLAICAIVFLMYLLVGPDHYIGGPLP